MPDNDIYPEGDMWGYYGKGLWYDFKEAHPVLAAVIPELLLLIEEGTNDPIACGSSYAHFEHKCYRVACLLGMAHWPSREELPEKYP